MKVTTLDSLPTGYRGKIIHVDAGPGLTSRLFQMGLVSGTEVKVIHNDGRGPVVLEVRGVEIALSRGVAKKVIVEVLHP